VTGSETHGAPPAVVISRGRQMLRTFAHFLLVLFILLIRELFFFRIAQSTFVVA
jgi:hypothetical protein